MGTGGKERWRLQQGERWAVKRLTQEKGDFFFFKRVGQLDRCLQTKGKSELITINQIIQIIHVSRSVATWAKQER